MHKFWNWQTVKTRVQNQETKQVEETTEQVLVINGPIAEESWFDDEVTPEIFKSELDKIKGDFKLYLNSPGGDCIAAARIYTMIAEHKGKVVVMIDGIAASAASVIAMAGTTVKMSAPAMMMIHNPMTMCGGNAQDMEQAIEVLNAVKESIINAYEAKTGLKRNKISELMDNETWLDAKKAIELGFCDEMLTPSEQDAMISSMSDSIAYEKGTAERNLTNKLSEKYLIKKPITTENVVTETPGVSCDILRARLEGMKKLI